MTNLNQRQKPKCKCQTHRPNPPSNTPREYYLRSLYIPLLDNVTADLNKRFTNKKNKTFMTLMTLIPTYLKDFNSDVIEKLIEVIIVEFEYLNIHKDVLRAELELWKSR
ncbi:zinc finger MYM-type protein 1-like, partial [Aphis craccivora]